MLQEQDMFEFHSDSLETLAEKINEVLGRPVTIEDANHRLVAYSSHVPETDAARIATIVTRRVPDKVISSLWHDGVIGRLLESEEPIRVDAINDVGLSERVAIAIRSNTEVLGYIWVLETGRAFTADEMAVLKHAAYAARAKMVRWQMQRHKEEESHKNFFWQLLTGHISSETMIREKAYQIGIALPPRFHIVVIQFGSEVTERLQQQAIEKFAAVSSYCRIVLKVMDKDELVLLCAPTVHKEKEAVVRNLELIDGTLRTHFKEAYAGLVSGSLYDDYSRLEACYKEALLLLQMKRRFREETARILYYGDLGYYRYLPLIWREAEKHACGNECLAKLKAYDLEHHSDLLHTLDVFLSRDSNIKTAADALHVHANTLNYRLKRISEIGGIDLTDMEQKVTLYLDMKAEKFGSG